MFISKHKTIFLGIGQRFDERRLSCVLQYTFKDSYASLNMADLHKNLMEPGA